MQHPYLILTIVALVFIGAFVYHYVFGDEAFYQDDYDEYDD